jgi:hypothetical protein
MRKALLSALFALGLAGCSDSGDLRQSLSDFPPQRKPYDQLPPLDAGIRARSVEAVLEDVEGRRELFWKGLSGTSGGVRVLNTWTFGPKLVCRSIEERMIRAGETFRAHDMACWNGTEWVWLRDSDTPPAVLGPARELPVYTARSTTTLEAVARATRSNPETLAKLNPMLDGGRVPRGATVILPPRGAG